MLGRKTYNQEELDHARSAIDRQLAAYKQLVAAIDTSDADVAAGLGEFEPLFLNHLTLALDRYFVHRLRVVTGKHGNPLNEVELLVESLINNDGVLRGNKVITLIAGESVLKLGIGDSIRLSLEEFERLSAAFLADLDAKFV